MYSQIRPLLFGLSPERAHGLTVSLLGIVGRIPSLTHLLHSLFAPPAQPVTAFGINFPNRIGLAAGYDKDGLAWRGLAALGFGHLELGTVTVKPQPGNPEPRLFRLVEDRALINRMGFPGRGAEFLARQLSGSRPPGLVIGVNIGKNRDTPLEEAAAEYARLVRKFAPLADYLAVNISSPNTIGLRRLQGRKYLDGLLHEILEARQQIAQELARNIPVLVKLAPDLSFAELEDTLEVIQNQGADGVIATNTTISRPALKSAWAVESGGLSGAPLDDMSTTIIRRIAEITGGKLPLIGVGGIMDAASAQAKFDAGAVLVQLYTGLVYAGPGLVKRIGQGLGKSMPALN